MRFAKGHGTENDFVILLDPEGSGGLTAGLTARLCDRRAGIGADGVLRAVRAAASGIDGLANGGPEAARGAGGPGWFMDYRNADGSVAEMCGNGIRVFARYLVRHGLAEGPEFSVATRSGPRLIRMCTDGGPRFCVRAPGRAVRRGPHRPEHTVRPDSGPPVAQPGREIGGEPAGAVGVKQDHEVVLGAVSLREPHGPDRSQRLPQQVTCALVIAGQPGRGSSQEATR